MIKIDINKCTKVYPKEIKLSSEVFLLIQKACIEGNENLMQATIFVNNKPYMHRMLPVGVIEQEIEVANNKLVSSLCDEMLIELRDTSEVTNKEEGKRLRVIENIMSEYSEMLNSIDDEITEMLVNEVFDEFVEGKIDREEVIESLKVIFETRDKMRGE